VGFSGKVPEDVDGFVEAAVGMKLSREWCVFHSSYGESGCGGGDASVVRWDPFQKGKVGVFCICGTELVVEVGEISEVLCSGGVYGGGALT
jgi:hypothetical protein